MTDRAQPPKKWDRTASAWSQFEPPYLPVAEDGAVIERVAADLAAGGAPLSVAMLGVTPQTAALNWPAGVRLTAYDNSAAMIAELWPAPGAPRGAEAVLADWADLPVETSSVDLVTGDHSLGVCAWPEGVAALLAEVRRILRPGGRFALRLFLRPDRREPIEAILADLEAGRIRSAGIARVRMIAALHQRGTEGISVQDLKDLFKRHVPDPDEAVRRHGWNRGPSDIPTTEGNERRFVFPTLAEARAAIAPFFREVECVTGSYELAERFPTMVLAPRP